MRKRPGNPAPRSMASSHRVFPQSNCEPRIEVRRPGEAIVDLLNATLRTGRNIALHAARFPAGVQRGSVHFGRSDAVRWSALLAREGLVDRLPGADGSRAFQESSCLGIRNFLAACEWALAGI